MCSKRPQVVIIGAGIAGIAAARALLESGKVDVCVLEGSERIGGRIHTLDIDGKRVELGANWLHGSRNNPLQKLCDKYEIKYEEFYYLPDWDGDDNEPVISGKLYSQEGKVIDDSIVQEIARVSVNLREECDNFFSQPRDEVNPFENSVGRYLWSAFFRYLAESDSSEKKLKSRVFEWLLLDECVNCAVDSLNELGLFSWGDYIGYEDQNFIVSQGFSAIIDVLYHMLPQDTVHLRHEVTRIDWVDTRPTTSSNSLSHELPPDCPVTVTCKNGQIFTADHVIITASLGVLKERATSLFFPPLPRQKLEAIDTLGFGTVNKIVLVFEEPLWPSETCEAIGFLGNPSEIPGSGESPDWISRLFLFHPHAKHSNILIGWLAGSANLEIENIPEEEIGNHCIKFLSKVTDKVLPKLLRVERSRWYGNPLIRGSYSYIPVNADGATVDKLAMPLPDQSTSLVNQPPLQLLFAGEATSRTMYATAHGAFCSGIREATRILKSLDF